MLIGIISDTHDNHSVVRLAVSRMRDANVKAIIHCGDWTELHTVKMLAELDRPLYSVLGNNDYPTLITETETLSRVEIKPDVAELMLDSIKIAITHGHHAGLVDHLRTNGKYDLVCSGHTHQPKIKQYGLTLHINPGSAGGRRMSSDQPAGSLAIYNTETKTAEIVDLA